MHLQAAVVLDEAELAELVHEVVDARPCRPHPRRQYLLTDVGDDEVQLPVLAELGEQQEDASQPLLARIEELIDRSASIWTLRDRR